MIVAVMEIINNMDASAIVDEVTMVKDGAGIFDPYHILCCRIYILLMTSRWNRALHALLPVSQEIMFDLLRLLRSKGCGGELTTCLFLILSAI